MLQNFTLFFAKLFSWLRSTYSEPDGTGSSTRLHIALLTGFTIAVGASFAYLVHIKSITIEQFDTFLGAAGTFLISTCGPLYGVNKLADWAKDKNQTDSNNKA